MGGTTQARENLANFLNFYLSQFGFIRGDIYWKRQELRNKKNPEAEPCLQGLTTTQAQPGTGKGPVAEAGERMGPPILKGEQNQSKKGIKLLYSISTLSLGQFNTHGVS